MEYKSEILQSPLFEGFANASDNVYIYVNDMSIDVSRWSPNAVIYFGLEGEYIEDAGNVWGEHVHPDDRQLYFDDIEAVFTGQRDNHACQYRAKNRFGKYVWLECKGRMIYNEDGEPITFCGMMTRLDSQSKYDPLTGVLTKNGLYEYDFDAESGTVVMFGIDNFRRVIGVYGYDYGDEVLTSVVRIITSFIDSDARFIRFQGDEFVIIMPGKSEKESQQIFECIQSSLANIGMSDDTVVSLSISGGAQCYPLKDGDKDDVISHLTTALTYAKQRKRGNIVFYSDEIKSSQIRKNKLKKDLKRAIAHDFEGFELYYQPWIDAKSSRIVGCETLLRFKGREIKDAGPFEFIPILEEDNGIIEVGRWVMRESIKQQKEWQDKYGDFKVSFNVSYRQFFEVDFADKVAETAKEFGVDPRNIVLELTESNEVDEPEALAHIFELIRSNDFHIALDDFGTGYASLEILKRLPVDEIKIEHNFVRELKQDESKVDLAIIDSIMYLCKKLECGVVVEGVENGEVDKIIRNMDADYLQGYHYSRPVCKKDFDQMLVDNYKE